MMQDEVLLLEEESKDIVTSEDEKTLSKIRVEFSTFLEWRWKYLFSLIFLFFGPVLLLKPSKFVLWLLLNMIGFFYVSFVTCERKDPISSRNHEHGARELVKLMLACPLVYWFGPYKTIADGNADEIIFMNGFFDLKYSGMQYYVIYDGLCYVIPFFLGLHFTYLDYFPFLQMIVLQKEALKKLSKKHWIFLCVAIISSSFLIAFHVYLLVITGLILYYGIVMVTVILGIGITFYFQRHSSYLHLHHYQLAAIFIILTPFQNIISAICQAIMAGVYVEGIARWSMASLLMKKTSVV